MNNTVEVEYRGLSDDEIMARLRDGAYIDARIHPPRLGPAFRREAAARGLTDEAMVRRLLRPRLRRIRVAMLVGAFLGLLVGLAVTLW